MYAENNIFYVIPSCDNYSLDVDFVKWARTHAHHIILSLSYRWVHFDFVAQLVLEINFPVLKTEH